MMEPTRYKCEDTLKQLGLYEDVDSLLFNSRLWSFASMSDFLYPDLAQQCLSFAKLTFANPRKLIASETTFSFFAGEKRRTYVFFHQPSSFAQILVIGPPHAPVHDPSQPPTDEDVMTKMPNMLPFRRASYRSEFNLSDLSDDADIAEYQRWMITIQRKNSSLMRRISSMVSRGCCHTIEVRAAGEVSHDEDTPETSTRFPRRRRKAGREGSESPDTASNA